jgi:DNA-binding beta-propeller fold protein YncE
MMSAGTTRQAPVVGAGRFRYEPLVQWERLPPGWSFGEVAGVATDSADRLHVFSRSEHPVTVFGRDGQFLRSWGEGVFNRPHGIHVGPDDSVWCTDDLDHTVRRFTPDGKLLLTLGTSGKPSDTGIDGIDYRTIRRPGPPFHRPTNIALAADGAIYATDGYGNARVHKFDPTGKLLFSWGEPGSEPGQFNLPHGITTDDEGLVYIADRENSRVQIFTPAGKFLTQWTDVARPMQVFWRAGHVFVAEVGWKAGVFPWQTAPPDAPAGRVSVFTRDGRLVSRWGGSGDPCAPGNFFAPHDLCLDSHGDLYVGEVVLSAGGNRGLVDPSCHALQKFVFVAG